MHVSSLAPGEEIFSWCDPEGATLHFAVARLNSLLAAVLAPSDTLGYPDGFDRFLLENRGVDIARAMALTGDQLAYPCTVLIMDGGHTLLADGTHRSYRRYIEGRRDGPCFLVPREVWQLYVITGVRTDQTEAEVAAFPTRGLPHRRP